MSQLERDLEKRASDKLRQWTVDIFDLFEMAGLEHKFAASVVMACLMSELGDISAGSTVPDLELAGMVLAARKVALAKLDKDPKFREWRRKHGVT